GVDQFPKTGDPGHQLAAHGQVAGRLAGVPNPTRGPGSDDVPGVEGDDPGDVGHQVDRTEHEVLDVGGLHDLAVDLGGDLRVQLEPVGGDQVRTERGGVLEGLALQPLLGAVLVVADGDVVEHRIASDGRGSRFRVGV